MNAIKLAVKFHELYEKYAPEYGYETKEDTKVFNASSPNGKLMIRVCRKIAADALADKEAAVHEWQDIAGQWEDKCQKLTEQIAALTESRDAWEWQWRLMEAAEKKAEEQIATLQEETARLYAITVEQSRQIAALNDALSGRDNVIEKLKGYLANKKTDITEKVEYIAALTEDRDKWQSKAHYQNQDNLKLTAENKRLEEEMVKLKVELVSHRECRFVDATPNGDLPRRILAAYIEGVFTTDNTAGIPPENPLCKLINETQEKRNIILRKAIDALKGKEAGDETITKEAITASRK